MENELEKSYPDTAAQDMNTINTDGRAYNGSKTPVVIACVFVVFVLGAIVLKNAGMM